MRTVRSRRRFFLAVSGLFLALASAALAQETEAPPAPVVNDEGGPVVIRGSVTYTNAFFTAGVAQPLIMLEDQAGFVDRNKYFLMSPESQTLAQITSDFYTSPFTYTLSLPIEPQGSHRDVDHDDQAEPGVQVFAIAYWSNTFGDPFLEERDLYGGGWSSAYASTRISEDADTLGEYTGGKILVYAPDNQQEFPSGFGEDALLFTDDDPIVRLPQGYTVVDMDADPFVFDRAREQTIDLIEPEGAALDDFSNMTYTEAFDAMVDKFRKEYAFTELKGIDWDVLSAKFRPRFEQAEENDDEEAYLYALRDFYWSIPDGHMRFPLVGPLEDQFVEDTDGGLGLAIRELDDGRVLVSFITEGGPADQAGIELRAEILALDGRPIDDAISATVPWSSPFSAEHFRRLQQLRYVTRFHVGTQVEVTYQNPGDAETTDVELTAAEERDSFAASSFNVGRTGFELPVEYRLLDSGYAYARIFSFSDNDLLSIQVWERLMSTLNAQLVPGLIIDMRQNEGGSTFLATQMAAYFFEEPLTLGNTGTYDKKRDEFYFDPRGVSRFYLPAPDLRYQGPVAVLIGPNCNSACEIFTYAITRQDRAAAVGQYPTAGLGGGQEVFAMPPGIGLQVSIARSIDDDGNVVIEGAGVPPTVRVPVDEETLFAEGDPILDAAIEYLGES